jgi:hypothetical protein
MYALKKCSCCYKKSRPERLVLCTGCHTWKAFFAKGRCYNCYLISRRAERRQRHRVSGACTRCGGVCEEEAKLTCLSCRKSTKERRTRLCLDCHTWKAIKAKGRCKLCYGKKQRAERRLRHRVSGACTKCGGVREEEGKLMCLSCRKHTKERRTALCLDCHTWKTIEAKGRCYPCYGKMHRAERRLSGACTRCGGACEEDGKLTCLSCRKGMNKHLVEKRLRRRVSGACKICGGVREEEGFVACLSCRKKARVRSQRK